LLLLFVLVASKTFDDYLNVFALRDPSILQANSHGIVFGLGPSVAMQKIEVSVMLNAGHIGEFDGLAAASGFASIHTMLRRYCFHRSP
jgi:hypothetical protein